MIISNNKSKLEVSNVTFKNNKTSKSRVGSAISTKASLKVENCIFKDNYTSTGAAIYGSSATSLSLISA